MAVWWGWIVALALVIPACEAGSSPAVVAVRGEPARDAPAPAPHHTRPPRVTEKVSVDTVPLGCLLSARAARVHLQFGYRGCFGGSDGLLDVSVAAHAAVRGRLWEDHDHHRIVDEAGLTRAAGMTILQSFVSAAQRTEVGDGEDGTTSVFARVFYWCDGRKRGPMFFEASDSAPELAARLVPIVATEPPHYTRAEGIVDAAEAALKALPSTLQRDSDVLRARTKKTWGSLSENGYRVRERPIEVWDDP